jgi:phospholipid-translocating ATPase
MPKRTGFTAWYDKVMSSFSIEDIFVSRRPPGPPRAIYINQPLPESYYDKKHRVLKVHQYNSNQVITSKYTLLTFLPRNLLEQFRRIANVFFLFIAILQFFPKFSTVSPALVLLPLIVVLGITALKDAYEDVKRHHADRVVNSTDIRVLEDPGYMNHNAMAPKSKTFVRALKKRFGKGKGASRDVQALGNSVPPESSEKVARPVASDTPDVEYDDDFQAPENPAGSRPHWKHSTWEDLRVGDFVKIMDRESIPADILICATSEEENVAFVETKNLDGETNLKSRNALPALNHLRSAANCADPKNVFEVECDRPEVLMHKLDAAVVINGERHSVDLQTTLLRGTVLRNTAWVIGIVMYTGLDTKLVLNAGGTPSKRSKVERQMNPMVLANLAILAAMATVCAIVDSVLEHHYYPRQAPWLWGDNRSDDNPSINGLITWAFALITFQNIVPISLYISVEAVRTCQAAFIYFDAEIYYEKTDTPALARTFTLTDDLGQIEYIFSDKTGTLTQNAMVFRGASVGGQTYVDEEPVEGAVEPVKSPDPSTISESDATPRETANPAVEIERVQLSGGLLRHFRSVQLSRELEVAASDPRSPDRDRHGYFWTTLALCHTVLAGIDPQSGLLEYKAQSPDEAALVQAAADIGFEFRGRDRDILSMRTPFAPEPLSFRLLNILEFTSSRKRMSVIVRQLGEEGQPETNPILLFTKGADNVIFERLAPGGEELKAATEDQLDSFAHDGLRTLTLAYRAVSEDEYNSWVTRYQEALSSIEDREGEIERVSDEVEQGLLLLGATAIEDKLQDGVPEAIADLKKAGIKIWVLTGDKLETAIAIGHSTNLIGREANIIIIRGGRDGATIYSQMLRAAEEYFPNSGITNDPEVNAEALGTLDAEGNPPQLYPLHRVSSGVSSLVGSRNGQRPGGYVLVIDGLALTDALGDEPHKHLLLRLAMECEGVLCCRVSPKQKALVVNLVKDGIDTMTLAIGDGANDVSMIQAADVGVGISGEEGLQAVNSSDYAIAQFRFLKRLLLVHGHWSYARNGNMINNFFYKNVICIGVLWWFVIYCGWSSAYVFDYTYLIFWNSFWTLCPVIAIGLFDRIVDDHVLIALPELYHFGREGKWFGGKLFTVFMFEGVIQSAIIFFVILYAYFSPSARNDGFDVAQYEFSTTMAIAAATAANLFNGLNTKFWTAWVFFSVFIGIILIWAYTAIYSIISPGWFVTDVYGNDHFLFRSPIFWFSILITVLLALLPRYLYIAWSFGFRPNDLDILNWNYKLSPNMDLIHETYLRQGEKEEARPPLTPVTPNSATAGPLGRPSMHASQIDMSTGMRSQSRGYDFAQEENGVAIRRMQTNLSGVSPQTPVKGRGGTLLRSLRNPLRRKHPQGEQ